MRNKLLSLVAACAVFFGTAAASPIYQQSGGITVQVCTSGVCLPASITISITPGTVPPVSGAPIVTVSPPSATTPVTTPPVTTPPPVTTSPVTGNSPSLMTAGQNGALNGYVMFPGSAFYQDVSNRAISPNNALFHQRNQAYLHFDFGNGMYATYGIPYTVFSQAAYPLSLPSYSEGEGIGSTTATVRSFPGVPESDDLLWPNLDCCTVIEGNVDPRTNYSVPGDHHAELVDRDTGGLWEAYQAKTLNGTLRTYNARYWDTTKPVEGQNPVGTTSVDAAGLPILPLLLKYDEVDADAVIHPLRMILPATACLYYTPQAKYGSIAPPAVHSAGCGGGGMGQQMESWMGLWLRLPATFPETGLSAHCKAIVHALKHHGAIVADNGGRGYITGVYDTRWDDDELIACGRKIALADMDVLDAPITTASAAEQVSYTDSVLADATGTNIATPYTHPVITAFTASATSVAVGAAVTFNATATNATILYVDNAGPMRNGTVTFHPTKTNTYTVYAKGAYGQTRGTTLTVTVQ